MTPDIPLKDDMTRYEKYQFNHIFFPAPIRFQSSICVCVLFRVLHDLLTKTELVFVDVPVLHRVSEYVVFHPNSSFYSVVVCAIQHDINLQMAPGRL